MPGRVLAREASACCYTNSIRRGDSGSELWRYLDSQGRNTPCAAKPIATRLSRYGPNGCLVNVCSAASMPAERSARRRRRARRSPERQ